MSTIDLQALQAEVADLAARRDIHKALNQYMRGQDRLLPDVQRQAFHEDAHVDCGLFADNFGDALKVLDGKTAKGEVYFIAHHRITENGEKKDLFVAGRYHDEYQDRGQGWKIARRKEIVDWARTDGATDSFLKEQTALHIADRGEHG